MFMNPAKPHCCSTPARLSIHLEDFISCPCQMPVLLTPNTYLFQAFSGSSSTLLTLSQRSAHHFTGREKPFSFPRHTAFLLLHFVSFIFCNFVPNNKYSLLRLTLPCCLSIDSFSSVKGSTCSDLHIFPILKPVFLPT